MGKPKPTGEEKLKREFGFDLYGRYAIIRDIINANRQGGERFRVLDVGGRGNIMQKFLPNDEVFYLDPYVETNNDDNYIEGDGCNIPLEDASFDFVVSADVFEHIPRELRTRFLEENTRVAKLGTILVAPFYSEEVCKAEISANESFKMLSGGVDHPWLKEHIDNGLPSEDEVISFLNKNKYSYQRFNNNVLILWAYLSSLMFLASTDYHEEIREAINDFNLFYNTKVFPFDLATDSSEPFYRRIFFVKKSDQLVDLTINNEPINHSLLLEIFRNGMDLVSKVDAVKKLISKQRAQEISNLNQEIASLNQEIASLNREIAAMRGSIFWKLRNIYHVSKKALLNPTLLLKHFKDLVKVLLKEGPKYFLARLKYLLLGDQRLELKSREPINSVDMSLPVDFLPKDWQDKFSGVREALEFYGAQEIDSLLSEGGKINFSQVSSPDVSIIIPLFNKAHYTYHCLRSILLNTKGISYEVIVVDDCSTDKTSDLLSCLENVCIIVNETNSGFIESCNKGASYAKGKYLCFLNNDTIVTEGWLTSLVNTMGTYPDCGAVGAKLVYPEGKLQEAGSMIWSDGSALGYGRGDDPARPEYSYLREVAYCSGACLLVDKEAFLNLGGFDKRYHPAYYEDSDLCFGVRYLGYKVVFQPKSIVYHLEFSSSSNESAARLCRQNKPKFEDKWRHILSERLPYSPESILRNRDERKGKKILVIDDRIPTPTIGAGFPRAYAMLNFLAELGYVVSFFPLQDSKPYQPWLDGLQQAGIEVFYNPYADFQKLLYERVGYYDAVIISRPHNAAQQLGVIKNLWTDTAIIYDAEALFCMRDILKAQLEGTDLTEKRVRALISSELKPVKDADAVITVSESERKIFLENIEKCSCAVWGHPLGVKKPKNGFSERKDILFVGGFLQPNTPNEAAITYFVNKIWPLIRSKLKCRLYIVGPDPCASVKSLASNEIIVTGFVKDLSEYYEKCRVFITPHRVAAGIPWKVQEAMSHGIPCVVSSLIGEQLGLTDGVEAMIGHDETDFAAKVIQVYEDEKIWLSLQQSAFRYMQETCDPSTLKNLLGEIVENVIKNKLFVKASI